MEPVELGTGWSHPLELDPVRKVGEKPNPQAEFGTPLAPILLLARDTEHFPQHGRANALPTCVLQELRAGVLCEVQALGRTLPGVKLQVKSVCAIVLISLARLQCTQSLQIAASRRRLSGNAHARTFFVLSCLVLLSLGRVSSSSSVLVLMSRSVAAR
eukprot:m.138424 g.138424  ORF g.138424 m.138424 type:complete len:158 (-) comp9957_c0_seq2:3748-4221(-)